MYNNNLTLIYNNVMKEDDIMQAKSVSEARQKKMETIHISSIPGLKEDIINGLKEPLDNCVSEDEVEW